MKREILFQLVSVVFDFLGVTILKFSQSLGIFFLGLEEVIIPLLIKFLVLLDMSLFAFFSLLGLIENQFLIPSIAILLLKFEDSILGHFSFNVLSFNLASMSVIF